MSRRGFLTTATAAVAAGAARAPSLAEAKGAPPAGRPLNVLILLSDDMGNHLGAAGTPALATPHLDRLAAEGVRFDRAYAPAASCSPCRASLLTGRYPHSHGIFTNVHRVGVTAPASAWARGAPWRGPHGLRPDVPTAPERFKAAGYRTGLTNKGHVGPGWRFPWDARAMWRYTLDRTAGGERLGTYRGARRFFEDAGRSPFFLYANLTLTHRPFRAHDPDVSPLAAPDPSQVAVPPWLPDLPPVRRDWARYLDTVQMTDSQVGEVLAALEDAGHRDDTLVVFTSDHGIAWHRAKATVYEAGTHVPLIVRGPGVRRGARVTGLVGLIDLLPTLLEACGLPVPGGIQGRSMWDLLRGRPGAAGRRFVFAEHNAHGPTPKQFFPSRAVRGERFKYIRNLLPEKTYVPPADLVERKKWGNLTWDTVQGCAETFPVQHALVRRTLHRPAEELYDLHTDPHEMTNLLEGGPDALTPPVREELARLRRALDDWMTATGDAGTDLM